METKARNIKVREIRVIPKAPRIVREEVIVKKKNVCGYARVSTDLESQATSYDAQVKYYTDYIQSNSEWNFVGLYSDEGISATSTKHREGFNRMINDALDGKIDLIITKSVSRFARNTVDSLSTIRKLKDKGIEVFFEKENIHTLDSKGELLITLMSSLSQEESRSISENTTWGKRKRFADGEFSVAYSTFLGYDKGEDGKLKVNKEQAEVVRLIYNLFLSGLTYYKIKQELEKRKLKSPTGKYRWHQSTIKNILLNEKYAGDAILQKTYTVDFLTKKTKVNNGELPQYVVTNDHEAIVPHEMFDAVKEVIKERGDTITKYVHHSPITKKLICGYCGEHLGRKTWHSNDNYRSIQYRCKNRYEGTHTCDNRNVREEVVQEEFVKAANEYLKNSEELVKVRAEELNKISDTSKYKKRLEELEKEKIDVINKLNVIDDVYARTGKDDNKRFEYNGRLVLIENEKVELNETISRLENRKINIQKEIDLIKNYSGQKKTRTSQPNIIYQPVNEFSLLLWDLMLEKAIVYKDRIEFVWKK